MGAAKPLEGVKKGAVKPIGSENGSDNGSGETLRVQTRWEKIAKILSISEQRSCHVFRLSIHSKK